MRLDAIVPLFSSPPQREPEVLRGWFEGQLVSYELSLESHGSSNTEITEVSAAIPPGLRLLLALRATTRRDLSEVARGLGVDLTIGDPPFDAAFIVEGAPERAVRALFADAELRAAVLGLRPSSIETRGDRVVIRIEEAWVDDPARGWVLLRLASRLAALCATHGGTYAHEEGEVARLATIQAARAAERRRRARLIAAALGALLLASFAVHLLVMWR